MGAHNNSTPKQYESQNNQKRAKQQKFNDSTKNANSIAKNNENLPAMADNKFETQKCIDTSNTNHCEVSEEQVSVKCTTQSQVQGSPQVKTKTKSDKDSTKHDQIEEINEEETSKQEKSQRPPERVSHINVIELNGDARHFSFLGEIGEVEVTFLVDTGSVVTCISDEVWEKLNKNDHPLESCDMVLESVNQQPLELVGKTMIKFSIQNNYFTCNALIVKNLSYNVILGRDFLMHYNVTIDILNKRFALISKTCNQLNEAHKSEHKQQEASTPNETFPFSNLGNTEITEAGNEQKPYTVHATSTFILPPRAETIIAGKLNKTLQPNTTGIVTSREDFPERYSIIGASELVTVSEEGTVPIRLMNPTANPVKIYQRTKLAYVTIVDQEIETFKLESHTTESHATKSHTITTCNATQTSSFEGASRDYKGIPDITDSVFGAKDQQRLKDLLYNYRDLFATELRDLGQTSLVQHTIETEGLPIKQRPYRTSPENKQEIERQVKEMCDLGLVEPSLSPWASPVVLVKKKDGSMRFCVDYRKLNAVTKKDSFPLPLINDVLDSLHGTNYFTTLDMKSGYFQIQLDPATKEKTAFVTHNDLLHFKVLPFGLTNSPATFQRLMGHILRGLEYTCALIYIDDTIIFSKTVDEHLGHIEEVFKRLRDANLRLNPKKCKFAKQELEYLGHIVTPQGIKPCPSKIKAIESYPVPKNVKQLRSFLGLANYYRRFIKDFAKIAHPLNQLTKKFVKFGWTISCQEAFDLLKRALISEPILAYPDFTREFHVTVDSSSTALGMTLSQFSNNGVERVIAYNGRNLSNAEVNYSTTEREALALVEAIKKYQPYLHGRKFTVHTDHQPLQWLTKIKEPLPKLARWSLYLQQFTFTVSYLPGKENSHADGLSRREYDKCELFAMSKRTQPDTSLQVIEAQRRDRELSDLISYLESHELPDDEKIARKLLMMEDYFYLGDDGLLYRIENKTSRNLSEPISQLVIPTSMRYEILSNAHDHVTGGHLGTHKTYQKLRARYWWKGMFKDTDHWCKSCIDCSMKKSPRNKHKAPLLPIPVGGAFDRVAVDIIGPLKTTTKGNKYIIVFMDYLTRWPEAIPVPTIDAATVARVFVDEIISRHGAPIEILSDRGSNFLSSLFREICRIFKIHKLSTSSYHPQTDGLVERFNGTLIQSLSMYVNKDQTDWDLYIPAVLFAYRVTPSDATQETPFYLIHGRQCRLPMDVDLVTNPNLSPSIEEHRKRIVENIEISQNIARENIQRAQQKMKAQYDKNAEDSRFIVGQQVWVYTPKTKRGLSKKLLHLWHGPYRLVEQLSPVHFFLRSQDNSRIKFAVHVNRMKPYIDPDERPIDPPDEEVNEPYLHHSDIPEESFTGDVSNETENQIETQDDPDDGDKEEMIEQSSLNPENEQTDTSNADDSDVVIDNKTVFEAEKIVKARKRKNKIQFKIKWKNFPNSSSTWEPEENIIDKGLIEAFYSNKR